VAIFLPPRKQELPVDDKSTSMFTNKAGKAVAPSASVLSTSRPVMDDSADIYKTHPTFVAIVEPLANKFMSVKELIEVKR
jgi:hypothetical protein